MHTRHGPDAGCQGPLQMMPIFRDYVWGGQRLRPGQLTAEAWVIYEEDRIASGPWAGRTLAQVAAEDPVGVLGDRSVALTGGRFPLLIKLLDCAQWLSLQVHPDDALALALEGPGGLGKTEAWHVLDATEGSRIIAGLQPGTTAAMLDRAVRDRTILDRVAYREVRAGDTVFMPARAIHALGPGLLVYEVQQASDITYRVYDWDRPATPGRELHIERSLAVADPEAEALIRPAPALTDGEATLVACAYFTLELLSSHARPVALDTGGRTFHALTVVEGVAEVVLLSAGHGENRPLVLEQYESAVIPAACGRYEIRPVAGCRVLKASIGQG